jgi:DNA-binding IclR family transcriptional regulator
MRTVIETGVPRPHYLGSSAVAVLAMLPQEEILSILNMSYTINSPKQTLKKIEEIKRRDYAVSIHGRYY